MKEILIPLNILCMLIGMLIFLEGNKTKLSDTRIIKYDDYKLICIDRKEFVKGCCSLSINLDFDGKPIACEERTTDE